MDFNHSIGVYSEVGQLKKVLVHCPDIGIGGVTPSKAQEWLYEDIVHLERMQKEFEVFKKILLAYLDPEKLRQWIKIEKQNKKTLKRSIASPRSELYVKSDKVIDVQDLLADILENEKVRIEIVSAICALEDKTYHFQNILSDTNRLSANELARILITGIVDHPEKLGLKNNMVWSPAPNFLFTRDIGITIGKQILLSRPASKARQRESMLTRYIAYHYFFKGKEENVIEINNDSLSFLYTDEDRQKSRVTIEGGDVMAVSPKHLLIGASERTTLNACQKTINKLFKDQCCDIERISIVQLPKQRAMMHLDTVMTQVTRNTWVLFKQLLEGESYTKDEQILIDLGANPYNGHTVDPAKVTQFIRKNLEGDYEINSHIKDLKALLTDISVREYGCKEDEVEFIYSADGELIHAEREQWTDSCNVTAIKEGVVLGYDRNDKTALCFKEKGFALIDVEELVNELTQLINNDENANIENFLNDNVPQKSLLMLPSGELSRARGGPHCMTMPIEREALIEKLKPVEYVEEKNAQISLVG